MVFRVAGDSDIYLVGGYTRDLLTGRSSPDRDYVVQGPMEGLAREVAGASGGRYVKLGHEGLHRVVLKGGVSLDFTPLRSDIERDLSLRDFTINSIAWSPRKGWIDPQGGKDDLQHGVIRMVSAQNLELDPLRILRAYRMAAELSFDIEPSTLSSLRALSFLVARTKGERITSEFFKILNLNNAPHMVRMMLEDGLLPYLIKMPCGELVRKVNVLDEVYLRCLDTDLKYKIRYERVFSQGLRGGGLLGIQVLLENMPDHLLVLSSKIVKRIVRFKKAGELLGPCRPLTLNRETLFDLFEAAGESAPDFLLIRNMTAYWDDLQEYIRIRRKSLLSAADISAALGGVSGPALGKAIRAVKKAEFSGYVGRTADALEFVRAGRTEGL